ncbi:unnamed protein product [Pleuronectes platessa]|uniref:Uncharacterized protein n=1 Tax=Pleuronectes platessa TaxID=8262 RepID=A0A9N7W5K1_PLEPL|nr:unnamed protein product [Pleuronectes platessa]
MRGYPTSAKHRGGATLPTLSPTVHESSPSLDVSVHAAPEYDFKCLFAFTDDFLCEGESSQGSSQGCYLVTQGFQQGVTTALHPTRTTMTKCFEISHRPGQSPVDATVPQPTDFLRTPEAGSQMATDGEMKINVNSGTKSSAEESLVFLGTIIAS